MSLLETDFHLCCWQTVDSREGNSEQQEGSDEIHTERSISSVEQGDDDTGSDENSHTVE